jgi:DNA (cytosine-5)-methyltransferase 1
MMNNRNFLYNIDQLQQLFKNNISVVFDSNYYKKNINKKLLDLREINKIIKKNNKDYNFSRINDDLISEKTNSIYNQNYKVLDLFCGAGGFSKGFEMAGLNIDTSIDINKVFIKTHKINFNNSKSLSLDLNNFKPDELNLKKNYFDVIIGSPPCQTFSSVGQGKIKSLNGDIKKDIRNYLYFSFIKFVIFFKPKYFLLENVPGFKTKYNGEMFDDFIKKLDKDYNISYDVVDAQNFGVPQSRKRLFIFGQIKTLDKKINIFENLKNLKIKKNTVLEAISDLPYITDDWRLDALYYSKNNKLNSYQKKMRKKNNLIVKNNICRVSNLEAKELFNYLKPGEKYSQLNKEIQKKIKLLKRFKSSIIHQRIKRIPLNDVCWTIIAHIGMDGYEYIHPSENRTLSVREAARLQGFPDDFIFTGNMREQYIQVGNSVSPLVSEFFGNKIYNCLKS